LTQTKNKWIRQDEDEHASNDYGFGGVYHMTHLIRDRLKFEEIEQIMSEITQATEGAEGIDYLQVFKKDGQKIYVIDNVSKTDLKNGRFKGSDEPYHYHTIMFSSEY